ncbi:MAG TPA: xanthine dehydrogenase family protein molybdopterin-binding subunit [Candidatus Acidoferrum sp.]|nr:xanthine dehydrogenase family protein molybdopterin-binding subunit [Candidatus Acidoferrum sp.]
MSTATILSRRTFLRTTSVGAAGLVLSVTWPRGIIRAAQGRGGRGPQFQPQPNAYLHVAPDETVTFEITKGEMGQGTVTSLAMLLAEELDCDWQKVRTEFAPVDPVYGNQGVYGSSSIRSTWTPLRTVGATARAMLIEAAAQKWGVAASQLHTENGYVIGPSGRLSYGSLAEAAAALPIPSGVPLKEPSQYRLIGKATKRLDTRDKICGQAKFGLDARPQGLVYAVLERCPVFGGRVASFDATKVKAVAGVKNVVQISNGVAVIADNTWSAIEGRKALEIKWDEGPNAAQTSAAISQLFAERAQQQGIVAKTAGSVQQALAGATKKIEAVYEAPYLAHSSMEPMNCTAVVRADSCEIWASTQMQTGSRAIAAQTTGLPPQNVKVNTMFMGGGFGRRGGVDYVRETVEVAQAMPGTPVKLTWTREDDMQHDTYRPAAYVKFAGALDADGWPSALVANMACPSFGNGTATDTSFGGGSGPDGVAVEGLSTFEYAIPNVMVDWRRANAGIPTSFWRSVGYSQNTFFCECFLDELAAAGGKDPVELRRRLLANSPRLLGVLNLAAEKADWGKAPAGHFQGVAAVNHIGSYFALVAEISMDKGKVRVLRVVCSSDCGPIVNPMIVRQQLESGIVYGLSAAMTGAITINRGRVEQSNFSDYRVLRINQMPQIEVYTVPTDNAPGGIGEGSVPVIAPAVCNAIFAATGKRIRRLPLSLEGLV